MAAAMPLEPSRCRSDDETATIIVDVLRAIVDDPDSGARSASILFQDFTVRCRMAGLGKPPLDLAEFTAPFDGPRRHFDTADDSWAPALEAARGPARRHARPLPPGRPRRAQVRLSLGRGDCLELRHRQPGPRPPAPPVYRKPELIVSRVDLSGKRSIAIPRLGWSTAAA